MTMAHLFDWLLGSGGLGALMAGVLVCESALLILLFRHGRQPIPVAMVISMNAAGLTLVVALHLALTDGPGWAVLMAVSGALLCHLVDLVLRWRLASKAPVRG